MIRSKFSVLFFVIIIALSTSCSKESNPVTEEGVGWAIGEDDTVSTILYSRNMGLNWEDQKVYLTEGVELTNVAAISADVAVIVGTRKDGYGFIMQTSNGGASWTRSGTLFEIPDVTLRAIYAENTSKIWVVGDSGTILRTFDGGSSWQKVMLNNIPTSDYYSMTMKGNNIWAAGALIDSVTHTGIIIHSGDGGNTWTRQDTIFGFTTCFYQIQAVNDTLLYASGYQGLFRTVDSGIHWELLLVRPGQHLTAMVATSVSDVWLASSSNVIYHNDTIGIPYANSIINDLSASDNTHVWTGGSYGSTSTESLLLYSNTAGYTWLFGETKSTCVVKKISFKGELK